MTRWPCLGTRRYWLVPNGKSPDKVHEVQEYVRSVAPEDIVRAIDWLLMNRWTPSGAKGGRGESFGNAQIEFERDGDRVTVARDRNQCYMRVQRAEWKQFFDLDIVVDTMAVGGSGRRSRRTKRCLSSCLLEPHGWTFFPVRWPGRQQSPMSQAR